uniref:Immunoglobulin V-set domain-containing protein n=1 Tax=Gasterosteus aculeatus aculeatus TaxID=481459 RepID=A0AAQ4P5W9_GASAC
PHITIVFSIGVTVVTQKPVVAVTTGETVSIDCNLGTDSDVRARWYKQIPGGVPQFVVYHYHSSSPTYGTGFSSSKFTSTHQSTTDYLRITVIYTVTKTSSLSTSAF